METPGLLLNLAGWATLENTFRVEGRTYWVVRCIKGDHHVSGRTHGDSPWPAWEAAYREAARIDASLPPVAPRGPWI
jgi:hypothetical protein